MKKEQIQSDLNTEHPLFDDYSYWIISSPLTYPSMVIYPDKDIDKNDFKRFEDIDFAETKVYQCDGAGGSDKEYPLSKFTTLPTLKKVKYKIHYVFDCTNIGSIYKDIECSEKNYDAKLSHEVMLSRIDYDLHYEEPCIIIKSEKHA